MCRATAATLRCKYKKLSYSSGLTSADVEPVWVVRREFLVRASFDEIYPNRDLELSGALQVRCIGIDEFVGTAIIVILSAAG